MWMRFLSGSVRAQILAAVGEFMFGRLLEVAFRLRFFSLVVDN
jgi:hypothetical protein